MSVVHGDCLDVMAGMEPASVAAVVTDPPYDLLSASRNGSRRINNPDNPAGRTGRGFMGKTWDGTGIAFRAETWAAALRLAQPGSYLLAFGGTRTVHRMAVAIEDAGWIIRDMLVWAYASGFPKSKASLKPAWEPIVMARKPGPLRMLAIDSCRIGIENDGAARSENRPNRANGSGGMGRSNVADQPDATLGRWPANVILTDPIFDGDVPGVVGGGEAASGGHINGRPVTGYSKGWADERWFDGYQDSGTYSRFFLIPKADRGDREPVLTPEGHDRAQRFTTHPTVKPTALIRHLVRLVTPRTPIWTCSTCGTVLEYDHAVQQSSTKPDVRDVRSDVLRGPQADSVLREGMRGNVRSQEPSWLPWLDHEPKGVHPGASAGASDGEPRGLPDAASADRGGDDRANAPAFRGRRSHQRDQERQPAGESAGHGQAGTTTACRSRR